MCAPDLPHLDESYDPAYTWSLHFEVDVKIGILNVVGSTYLLTVKWRLPAAQRVQPDLEYEMMNV